MVSHRSRQRFSMTQHCMSIHSCRCLPINFFNSCIACKSLPVTISTPLVPSLKRHRTLSNGGRNSPKTPLRHRLSVSFSPHVQVPNRTQSGNDSDETHMGLSRARALLQDGSAVVTVDDKALVRTQKLERSSSINSFTTVKTAQTTPGDLDAVSNAMYRPGHLLNPPTGIFSS